MTLTEDRPQINRARSPLSRQIDQAFVNLTGVFAIGLAVVLVAIAAKVGWDALPAMQAFGLGFLTSSRWDAVEDVYGALPQIYGTIMSSLIALVIAFPIGVGVAIFLSEDFLPPKLQRPIVFLVELLAAIPSVVYGLWGIFVLIPILRDFGVQLHGGFGWIPLFSTIPTGPGMYVAGVILAMGETMATTMVIGNANRVNFSLFDQGSTIASLMANNFAEASGLQFSSLMYAAFVLFVITLVVNVLAELVVRRVRIKV
jgi:phosphate transport system permease protein